MADGLRLTDILTTATAAANYLGAPVVLPEHLLSAIQLLSGELTLDDLGRPLSPLVARVVKAGSEVDPRVKELAGRWFDSQGRDVTVELSSTQLNDLRRELEELVSPPGSGAGHTLP